MLKLLSFTLVVIICYALKAEITLKAKTSEDKDLGCITLLKLASEKSKNAGEMIKYEKLKKLQKSFQSKYEDNHFSKAVCLNAAAGLIVSGKYENYEQAYNYARDFIKSGAPYKHLVKIQNA